MTNKTRLLHIQLSSEIFICSQFYRTAIIMNRLEFEELELQVQQSGLPLKAYL